MHLENKSVSKKFFWTLWIMYAVVYMTKSCYSAAMASIVHEGVLTKSQTGFITAAFYFDSLYTEFICDTIHVSKETLKTSYKIIGPERFVIVTDALKAKHSDIDTFQLFGESNIVTMFGATTLGAPYALGIVLFKAAFALITRGTTSIKNSHPTRMKMKRLTISALKAFLNKKN